MKIELALDRAGLWWSGLGFNLHLYNDPRAANEPAVWFKSQGELGAFFRLWNLEGAVARIA